MNATQKAAIAAIERQQPKNRGTVWCCGEQLKEICRREADSAELILTDMTGGKGRGLADAEKKIREFARGNGGAASPYEAEAVLRKFYGLREQMDDLPAEETPAGKVVHLADFL